MNDIEVELYDVNYIPDYVEAEEQRQANEVIRQANEVTRQENEADRIALYNDLEAKKESDYWRGEKGDKGDKGDPGEFITATLSFNGNNPTLDMTFAEIYAAIQANQEVRLFSAQDDSLFSISSYTSTMISFSNVYVGNIVTITLKNDNTFEFNDFYITNNVSSSSDDRQIPTAKAVYSYINTSGFEKTSNKTTSISSSSTDSKYPTAKAVYTFTNSTVNDAIGYVHNYVESNYAHTLNMSQNLTTGDLTVGISDYNGTVLDYGTVEGIATRDYVDDLVGDIAEAIDILNGEII